MQHMGVAVVEGIDPAREFPVELDGPAEKENRNGFKPREVSAYRRGHFH